MRTQKRHPGTPNRQVQSARKGPQAKSSVARTYRTTAENERENHARAFRAGLALGFAAAALAFGLILWLWVVPAMDGAVATAQAAYRGAVAA